MILEDTMRHGDPMRFMATECVEGCQTGVAVLFLSVLVWAGAVAGIFWATSKGEDHLLERTVVRLVGFLGATFLCGNLALSALLGAP